MTDDQRALLADVRTRIGQLIDSLRASRDGVNIGDGTDDMAIRERARYRYPLRYIDQADIELGHAQRYDERNSR